MGAALAPDRPPVFLMRHNQYITEVELARLAREARAARFPTQAEAAEALDVSQASISRAESEQEAQKTRGGAGLHELRVRMIEAFTDYTVSEVPYYQLKKKAEMLADHTRRGRS